MGFVRGDEIIYDDEKVAWEIELRFYGSTWPYQLLTLAMGCRCIISNTASTILCCLCCHYRHHRSVKPASLEADNDAQRECPRLIIATGKRLGLSLRGKTHISPGDISKKLFKDPY